MAISKRCAIAALAAIINVGLLATAQAQTLDAEEWTAKLDSGTEPGKSPVDVTVVVSRAAVSIRPKAGSALTILTPSVKEVSYDTRSQRRTKQGAILMAASPLGGLLLARSKRTQHFVSIQSDENAQPRTVVLELGKDDYAGFLEAMKGATGQAWIDLAKERKVTEDELRREKDHAIDVKLDRAVVVDAIALKPGRYQLVLLERAGNSGELYFFPGKKVNPEASVVHTTVDVVTRPSGVRSAEVIYGGTSDRALVSEIRLAAKVLRLGL